MRKTIDVTIADDGRDKSKVFRLTEMPAAQAEKMAVRALLAMAKSGVDVPEDVVGMGLMGLVAIGVRALRHVEFADLEPLLDELMGCVQVVPDRQKPQFARPLMPDDVEEVRTYLTLRKALLELHVGFSLPAAPSASAPAATGSRAA